MSALTTNTTLFGARGVQDPRIFKTGVAIKRRIDFGRANATASTNYEFLPLPAGFVMTGLLVEELKKCASGTITVKGKSDSATIGSAVTVGGSTLAKSFAQPKTVTAKDTAGTGTVDVGQPVVFLSGEMLCIVPSANMAQGEVEITVHGFLPDGDALDNYPIAVPYRSTQSAADRAANKSGGDFYAGGGNVN